MDLSLCHKVNIILLSNRAFSQPFQYQNWWKKEARLGHPHYVLYHYFPENHYLYWWRWKLYSEFSALLVLARLFLNTFKVSWSAVRTDVSQSLWKFRCLWLLAQLFFTFHVGTLIITLSCAKVDLLTRFSVKRHFFCTFEEEKCKILFWANLLHTYIYILLHIYCVFYL